MARIRSIKPDFWTSEQVMECSPIARLMFIGLWNFADDHGRLPCAPKTIKAQIFPADDINSETVRGMIDELSANGLVQVYVVDDKEYLFITGWRHQKIDKRQQAKYPEPPAYQSPTIRRTVSTDLRGSEGIGEERKNCADAKAPRTKQEYSDEFETKFWTPYPRSPTMSKKEAWREWMKLDPTARASACQAIEPYRKHLRSKPTLETVHACRFLSQRRFEGFGEAPPSAPTFDIRSSLV
ncbi:MAG: hypothetical protein JWQ01_4921 [Massilia sp.]|nr:hypothetical protein [Massilia sp.]